jgi:hypothetical protein
MPPEQRLVPRFPAEPPQEPLPYGRWEERLTQEFLTAALALDGQGEEIGEPGELVFYPDRSWHGRSYVPVTCATSTGLELFGYVRFVPSGEDGGEASEFTSWADFTTETAERNPDWKLDLCDEVIGSWRGESGAVASMTLVWGRPLVSGGAIVTAELAGLTVDQCTLVQERFTLIAADDYRQDLLEIKLYDGRWRELAGESLYAGDDDEEEEEEEGKPAADEETPQS